MWSINCDHVVLRIRFAIPTCLKLNYLKYYNTTILFVCTVCKILVKELPRVWFY